MAKGVKKTISIFLDGKEVENSAKAIQEAIKKATKEIDKMAIGSQEYVNKAKQIQKLNLILDEHEKSLKKSGYSLKSFIDDFGKFTIAFFGFTRAFNRFKSLIQEYAQEFAKLDTAMVQVQKYTGLTRKEVEELNAELKKIDTTTPLEHLNLLAAKAGDLGIKGKENILTFVNAADKINQTLGKSLGDGAVEQITKLTQIFGTDKTMGAQGAILATSSAINELDKQTSASGKSIYDFTTNLSAVGKAAGITQADIMGLGATLSANLQDGGASAQALTKFLSEMYKEPAKFAKVAGMDIKQFSKLIKEDANGALLQLFDTLNQKGGFDALVPLLNELGLSGQRTMKIFTTLAANTDDVRKNQELANKTYNEGTSIINDFNVANETAAAELEKAKNKVTEAKQELGESLIPIFTKLTEGTASFFKTLSTGIKFIVENQVAVYGLVAATAALLAIRSRQAIADRIELIAAGFRSKAKRDAIALEYSEAAAVAKATAAQAANTAAKYANILASKKLWLEKNKELTASERAAILLTYETIHRHKVAAATAAQTAATQANTKALHAQKIALAGTPWGAMLTVLLLLVPLISTFASGTNNAKKAMKEFREESAKQEAQAKHLFDALKRVEIGSKEYHDILTKLKELYPDIIAGMINEKGELHDINGAYQVVIKSIREKIALQMQETAVTAIIEKSINKQKKLYDSLRLQLEKRVGADVADIITGKISEGIENGNIADVLLKLKKQFPEAELWKVQHVIDIIVKDIDQMNKNVDKTNKSFGNLVPKKTLTELELMNLELQELNLQLQLAETKSEKKAILEDIRLLKEKIELKKKEVTTTGGVGSGTQDDKTADAWKKLNEQIAKLQDDRRKAQLIGFEKERDQINSQYDKLIEEAKKFGIKGEALAAQLETEKGEAVLAAAQKYLEKYADFTKKFQEEILKLAEKTAPSSTESKFINDLMGSEKEWTDKINSIAIHFTALEEMYRNATTEDEKAGIKAKMEELYDAKLEAELQFQVARNNIIQKYTQETAKFVEDSVDKQYLASLSNKEREKVLLERQKAEVKERYDEEIKRVEELIAAKLKLKVVNEAEIAQLKATIIKLKELRKNSDVEVKIDVNTGGDVWEQLLNFDFTNFAENWRDGLNLMATAGQDLANTMFSVLNSMNQVALNNMQKELNAFKKAKDKELQIFNNAQKLKKNGLDKQVKDGVISQEYYNAQVEKMEEEKAAKEKQIADEKEAKELAFKKEQFRREKNAAIIQAVINGALAIMQGFAQAGPIGGAILAALMVALTAAQIAAISSQPEPYKFGGFTGKKKNRLIQVNEEGEEWIASNKLLQDRKTAPIIGALEQYQQGNKSMLDNMYVSTPSQNILSQAATGISNNFTSKTTERTIERYYETSVSGTQSNYDEMTAVMGKLYTFLENNKTLNAVISRKMQQEVDKQDEFLKRLAKI